MGGSRAARGFGIVALTAGVLSIPVTLLMSVFTLLTMFGKSDCNCSEPERFFGSVLLCAVIAVVLPILAILMGILALTRLRGTGRTSGTGITGLVLAGVSLLISCVLILPSLIDVSGGMVQESAVRAKPPTSAETSYSAADLKARTEDLVKKTLRAMDATDSEPIAVYGAPCTLSNHNEGVDFEYYSDSVVSHGTADVVDRAAAFWKDSGFAVTNDDSPQDGLRSATAHGDYLESAEVQDFTVKITLDIESICVAK